MNDLIKNNNKACLIIDLQVEQCPEFFELSLCGGSGLSLCHMGLEVVEILQYVTFLAPLGACNMPESGCC